MINRRNTFAVLVLLVALVVPFAIVETHDIAAMQTVTLEFLSEEDLLQFTAIASLAWKGHSWDELLRSVCPGLQSACTSAQVEAIGEIEAVRTGAAVKDRLLADVPGGAWALLRP